ncbi:MAG: flagellar filament capping protein FliD [Desulfovibrio sp.]|nr:flagellar filament capping protein FliD [Desulfovibrio sp.]
MSISLSGSNSISGLGGNDTNFDKVLEQLKHIESTQLRRLESWKSDWNLRYEAFGQVIEQVQAASNMLSSLTSKNNFVTKNVNSSDANILTAVANASAQDVQHSINVTQVASNAIWANTGHVFSSKEDVINDSGSAQQFRFNYAGKDYSINIPNKTSLESFVNLVNNSTENPGIKVSLIQTGSGYVFQVAGKDTGAANDLIVYHTNLVGMDATGTQSTWLTNNSVDPSANVTNPSSYIFDLVLENGTKKSITVSGKADAAALKQRLEEAAGTGLINVTIGTDGAMTIDGVQSFSRRLATDDAYTPASTWVGVGVGEKLTAKLNAAGGIAEGLTDTLTFTMTMDDGSKRQFSIAADATGKDLLVQMAQAAQGAGTTNIGPNASGSWGLNLAGVAGVSCTDNNGNTVDVATKMGIETTAASGVRQTFGGTLTASTTLTFDDAMLNKRIDGKDSGTGETLRFTLVGLKDPTTGVDRYIEIDGSKTNAELLQMLKNYVGDTTSTNSVTVNGVKELKLTTGSMATGNYTAKLESSIAIGTGATGTSSGYDPTTQLFYSDDSGKLLLEKAPDLEYTITLNDGAKVTVTAASGTKMEDIISQMETALANTGATVELVDANGKAWVDEATSGAAYLEFTNVQSVSGPGVKGQVASSDNWSIQRAANARFQVDNWPVEMESETNSVSDVIEGVIFSIQDVGQARISVSTDVTSVEQSIQNFLDAVNSVLLTINQLTSYDEDKEVTSNDPNDMGNSNYSSSGLTNQKGGLLMGNYGVQLFESRFTSLLTSSPAGFQSRTTADDLLSGDVLATLANMGIKMDTTSTSNTYGLFVIAPDSGIAELKNLDAENYNNMITNNLEAVVDFFCASGSGSSSTADFRYGSHVEGITKAGIYDVEYSVDINGNIEWVKVGGVEATRDESQPGYYYSVASGDARGLSIVIDDLTPDKVHTGEVRIKEGLVQTVNSFLKSELTFNDVKISANSTDQQYKDAIALKSQNGALMVLRDNYKNIMENIDVKIEREQHRISLWESRQKQIFANLETLLAQYSEKQSTLESQLKQLGGND